MVTSGGGFLECQTIQCRDSLLRPSSSLSAPASSLFSHLFPSFGISLALSFFPCLHPYLRAARLYSLLTRFCLRHPAFWVKCEGAFDRKALMIAAQSPRHFRYISRKRLHKERGNFLMTCDARKCILLEGSVRTVMLFIL